MNENSRRGRAPPVGRVIPTLLQKVGRPASYPGLLELTAITGFVVFQADGPDGLIEEVDLSRTSSYQLGPEEWVVLAAHDALGAAEVIRRERIAPAQSGESMRLNATRQRPAAPRLPQMAVALFGRDLPMTTAEPRARQLPAPLAEVLI